MRNERINARFFCIFDVFMHGKIAVFHENRNDWCMFWAMFTFVLNVFLIHAFYLQVFVFLYSFVFICLYRQGRSSIVKMGIPCTSLTLSRSQRKTTKIFVKGMIFGGSQKFFRVDFGFSLCYNEPNDKGNVLGTYIGMEFRPIYLQGTPFS